MTQLILSTIALLLILAALSTSITECITYHRKKDINKQIKYLAVTVALLAVYIMVIALSIVLELITSEFSFATLFTLIVAIGWLVLESLTLNKTITIKILNEKNN